MDRHAHAPEAQLAGSAPVGMALWDGQLRCLWANAALVGYCGRPEETIVGARAETAFGDLGPRVAAALERVSRTGEALVDGLVVGPLGGRPETAGWRLTGFRTGDGHVGMLLHAAHDGGSVPAGQEAQEHFRLLVEGVTDYAIFMLDVAGRVITWNAGAQRILGYTADEVLGAPVETFHPRQTTPGAQGLLERAARDGRAHAEAWRVRKDGSRFWAGIAITALHGSHGELRGYAKVVRDLTVQRAAHLALVESETMLRSVLQSASDGVLVVDHVGRIVSANERAEQLFGYTADDLVGQPIELLVPARLRDVHRRYRSQFLEAPGTRPMGRGLDLTARRRDGTEFPVEVGLGTAEAKDGPLITVVVTDITQRKQVEQQLAHQATHDSLTGLPNRSLFCDRLATALRRIARRSPGSDTVAVLFFDLDRFKVINDSLGHPTGDAVLNLVAARLRELLRPSDTVARFGGDEFAMLCEGLGGADDAARIARRVLDRLAHPLKLPTGEHVVTPSIGIALSTDADADPEALLRDADAAMYRAKERGRSRFELFDAALRGQVIARLELENGLRGAVQRDELELLYQPVVALHSGRPVAAEALVRWQRPGHGLVLPDAFIPVAEETGLITSIGAWVIRAACEQAARWQRHPAHRSLQVAVNLSVRQLAQPDIVDVVARAVDDARLDPRRLRLEITESALMEDPEASLDALRGLSRLGASVAIDDFGTGYSSLSRLRQFPVHALKVDRAFVQGLGRAPEDFAIVAAVVALADAYGITTVAEGVETRQQVGILRDLGCQYAQGYLYSPPGPSSHVERLLG